MASVVKCKDGYRAQVYVKGTRESKTFRTKREADAWASSRETFLREESGKPIAERFTFVELARKYGEEVSIKKRGKRWELVRIETFIKSIPDIPVGEITPQVMAEWRDKRLSQVSCGSVLREISLLSAMFETARIEWRWIKSNPMKDIRKPSSPDHRRVTITRAQIRMLLREMKYKRSKCGSMTHAVAVAFLVALRTGMRAGELCGLTWDRVREGYCILPVTKTIPRDVPLSWKAQRLIESMRGWDDVLVFGLQPQTLSTLFRRYRDRAGISGITFHDSRHTAATWVARKLDVLDLCKMFGWTNTRHALVYYNPKASDIARRL